MASWRTRWLEGEGSHRLEDTNIGLCASEQVVMCASERAWSVQSGTRLVEGSDNGFRF